MKTFRFFTPWTTTDHPTPMNFPTDYEAFEYASGCTDGEPVTIQLKVGGDWFTLFSDMTGSYWVADDGRRYRACAAPAKRPDAVAWMRTVLVTKIHKALDFGCCRQDAKVAEWDEKLTASIPFHLQPQHSAYCYLRGAGPDEEPYCDVENGPSPDDIQEPFNPRQCWKDAGSMLRMHKRQNSVTTPLS